MFQVTASGPDPLSYQWYFSASSLLANATNASLALSAVTVANAGNYFVIVTNAYGSVTSTVATLAIASAPYLTSSFGPGGFQLTGHGLPGTSYLVQAATNLSPTMTWVTLSTNAADSTGLVQFTDANSPPHSMRFYRLVLDLSTPGSPPVRFSASQRFSRLTSP